MSKTLAAIILGAFMLLSAVAIAAPDTAETMGTFAMTVLWWVGICIVTVIIVVVALTAIVIWWMR